MYFKTKGGKNLKRKRFALPFIFINETYALIFSMMPKLYHIQLKFKYIYILFPSKAHAESNTIFQQVSIFGQAAH